MMQIQAIQCPQCPSWAVCRPTGALLASNPPQTEMAWWCDCGFRAPAPPERGSRLDDEVYESWRAANQQRLTEAREQAARRWFKPWTW